MRRKFRNKIVLIGLCCVSLMTGLLSGCGEAQEKEIKSIKIGVSVYNQYDTFVSQLMEKFNQYAAEKEAASGIAINIEVYNASENQITQNEQVATMIQNGCDVICVNLVDRTEPTTIIDIAEKNEIPVIFFNRELVEEDLERWERLYYVGAKALESGIMEGEIAAEAFKTMPEVDKNGDGIFQYVVLEGEAGHQDAIMRTEYSVNTIIECGVEVEKISYAIANWNRAQAQTKTTQIYEEYKDRIELILANNDDMALGAIDAMKALQVPREDWPIIVGIDGTDVGLEAMKNGEMFGTVYNDKEGQAYGMLNLAFALATEMDLTQMEQETGLTLEEGKYIRLPYTKLGPNELDQFMESEK